MDWQEFEQAMQAERDAEIHANLHAGQLSNRAPQDDTHQYHHKQIDDIQNLRSSIAVEVANITAGMGDYQHFSNEYREQKAAEHKAKRELELAVKLKELETSIARERDFLDDKISKLAAAAAENDSINQVALSNKIASVPSIVAACNSLDDFIATYEAEQNPVTRRALQEVAGQYITQKWPREIKAPGFIKRLGRELAADSTPPELAAAREKRDAYNLVLTRYDNFAIRLNNTGIFASQPELLSRQTKRKTTALLG